ncbi:DUF58 domain-containing protein, partial [Microbacterium sp. AGC62]
MFITGRLAVALAVGVVPLVLAGLAGYPAYAVLGAWIGLCIVLVVVDVSLAASARSVTVSRRVPKRARLGEQVPVSVAVHNHGTRAL